MSESAQQYLTNLLNQWGLGPEYKANDGSPLASWAWGRYLETGDADQVMIELRQQQGFKDRFPAYDFLAKQGRALSPTEYVTYERSAYAAAQAYGIPAGMITSDTISDLLKNDVSAAEISERMAINAAAMLTAPDEVRDALRDMYGLTEGGMLAYYLDPDNSLPKLQQQFAAAQISGAALEREFALTRQQAEDLAARGITYEGARQAAGAAAGLRGLHAEQGVSEQDLLMASLGEEDAARAVQRAALARQGRFEASGRAIAEESGISGLAASSS